MTTLATLQRKTATLEQETRRRYPVTQTYTLEDWLLFIDLDQRDQARRFLESIEPHLGVRADGKPDLTGLTDDEFDELQNWFISAKANENASKK